MCRSGSKTATAAVTTDDNTTQAPTLAASSITSASPGGMAKATLKGKANAKYVDVLIDTGSTQSFVSLQVAQRHKWEVRQAPGGKPLKVLMASTAHSTKALGHCVVTIELTDHSYSNVELTVLPDLCADVILGHFFTFCPTLLNRGIDEDRAAAKQSLLRWPCSLPSNRAIPVL